MKRFGVKFWQLILGILCICIIVLGVWVVITIINQNNNVPQKESPYATIHTATLEELNKQAAELPVEEARLLYESAIENATTDLEREQTKTEYGRYLLNHNLDEEGLNKLLSVDNNILGANYKMLLYAALRDYFEKIDNTELYEEYNNMIGEAIKNSEYAIGG